METSDQGRKAKGENAAKRISTFCPYIFPVNFLEAEAQPQANGPAIVNALVRVALYEPSEKRVGIDPRNRQKLSGIRVDI